MPQKVEDLSGLTVCTLAASDNVSYTVKTNCELYTWGSGYRGRLGHGDVAHQPAPKCVQALRDEWVVAVSIGKLHTIAGPRSGSVLGWGAADGLGLSEARNEEGGGSTIMLPCRYPQLACEPSC